MTADKINSELNKNPPHSTTDTSARIRRADYLGEFLCTFPRWAAYAIIAWQAALSIEALAGKNAFASFLVRFGRETSYWELICWLAGLWGIISTLYTRHLLRRVMARDASRMDLFEKRMHAIQNSLLSDSATQPRSDSMPLT